MVERIIKVLKEHLGNYVSGETLAKISGITRAGIWKQINQLREMGYEISSSPRKGYCLTKTPELNPFEILEGLKTKRFGREIHFQPETDSTNRWAKRLAVEGAVEGGLCLAESQTQGRGRLGRSWFSTPGKGLCFSLVLRPKINPSELAGMTILTAVSMAQAIYNVTKIQVQVKWPNDLVFDGRKLAGILAEVNGEADMINYLIIGLGLNVNQRAEEFPDELKPLVASLQMIKGSDLSRRMILQEFLRIFEINYDRLPNGSLLEIVAYAKKNSATLGKTVRINQGYHRTLSGEAVDLDDDGSLWLKEPSGSMIRVYAGEIIQNTEEE
ncbi:MAG: biotin--[acetyl-CoA-carboxylase] ligase [Firmicutes bacterium]|nr:biotin--[acetyl-CoA-carboxylase] ligase [Bacillota bacterium]